jgi:peptide-methionine (S)-S-oxide reductase
VLRKCSVRRGTTCAGRLVIFYTGGPGMRISIPFRILFVVELLCIGCGSTVNYSDKMPLENAQHPTGNKKETETKPMDTKSEVNLATFGGGCFWCTEAIFQRLKGVEKVVSGYSGGHVDHPTYEQVCSGKTGHAESIQITYDPAKVSYSELLEVFWRTHDPTTRNRQGNDTGPQYRSVIFYHDEEQKKSAEAYKGKLESEHIWDHPIVTEIVPYVRFWPAEDYHQNYYNSNPSKGYCSIVITPKIEKFKKIFKDRLKPQP